MRCIFRRLFLSKNQFLNPKYSLESKPSHFASMCIVHPKKLRWRKCVENMTIFSARLILVFWSVAKSSRLDPENSQPAARGRRSRRSSSLLSPFFVWHKIIMSFSWQKKMLSSTRENRRRHSPHKKGAISLGTKWTAHSFFFQQQLPRHIWQKMETISPSRLKIKHDKSLEGHQTRVYPNPHFQTNSILIIFFQQLVSANVG